MVEALNAWSLEFTLANFTDITRSGASGYDALADILTGAFDAIEDTDPAACNLRNLAAYAEKPQQLARLAAYGTPVYRFNMKANQKIVELAALGATKGPLDATLRPEDERALQKALESLMRDSWVRDLQMQVMLTGAIPDGDELPNINACKVARSAIKRFKSIPDGTKTRLMGMAGDLAPMISAQMAQLPRR